MSLKKHVPQRMCVICRRRFDKGELRRHVLDHENKPVPDEGGASPGRGFYCCGSETCAKKFLLWKPVTQKRRQAGVIER